MTKHERLMAAYKDAKEILDSIDIEYGPIASVTVNNRKASWGCCKFDKKLNKFFIEINSSLLDESVSYEALMDTLIHEMLHAHKSRFYDGHRDKWKMCANRVNYYYPQFNIKRVTSTEEKGISDEHYLKNISYKYEITCDNCGFVNKYQRAGAVVKCLLKKSKNSNCRCGVCGCSDFTIKCLTNA